MNPVRDSSSTSVDTVVLATTADRTEACDAVDVPSTILWVLTEKTTAAVTSASILGRKKEEVMFM